MQLKPVLRMITVCVSGIGLLVAVIMVTPASPVQGYKRTIINTTYQSQYIASLSPVSLMQEVITDTLSTTPDKAISESAIPATTSAPTSTVEMPTAQIEQPGIISEFIGLIHTKPWIPLGFILVILLTALTMILVTVQRKTAAISPTWASGGTAKLPPKPVPAQEKAFLQLKLQPETTFPLFIDDLKIGRASDNSIVILPDMPGADTVSHYHARLYRIDRWILEDLDSTNGTYVNGQRTGRNYLRNGWEIGIGGVIFVFHTGEVEV